jgi:hypothetical protein
MRTVVGAGVLIAVAGGSCIASAASGGSRLTRPGTTLKPGHAAVVEFDTITPKGKNGPSYKLRVEIESIKAGSITDFKGISLSGVPKGDSPTYVRVKMTNISGKPFSTKSLDPANAVEAVDGNNLGSSVIITGYFAPCPDADTPSPFKAGQTFTTCETYMQKGKATKIAYDGSRATLNSPIIWSL